MASVKTDSQQEQLQKSSALKMEIKMSSVPSEQEAYHLAKGPYTKEIRLTLLYSKHLTYTGQE